MTLAPDTISDKSSSLATAAILPTRKEAGLDLPAAAEAPQKDIQKTVGGITIHGIIHYFFGWIFNSSLSLGIAYYLNPRPEVKNLKETITKNIGKIFGRADHVKTLDSVRSVVEIWFMMIAGIIATGLMTPLLANRDKIAYWINQKLGKDTNVLPDEMKPVEAPKTLEDKIEQEIKTRVNGKRSAFDLWAARAISMAFVIIGDIGFNRLSRHLENANKPSIDTLSWSMGQRLYKTLPAGLVHKWNKWFEGHGAGIGDLQANSADHFNRLEKSELEFAANHGGRNEDRMVVAEQSRLITKEWGWALICAVMVDKYTNMVHSLRMDKQHAKVVQDLTKEGIIPQGYKVSVSQEGKVKLEEKSASQPENISPKSAWSEKSTKSLAAQNGYVNATYNNRALNAEATIS